MDFQSIFGWKSVPEADSAKTLLLMLIDVGLPAHLRHPTSGASLLQADSSEPLCLYTR